MIWLGVIAFALWVLVILALGVLYIRKGRALVHSLAGPSAEEMEQAQALLASMGQPAQQATQAPSR